MTCSFVLLFPFMETLSTWLLEFSVMMNVYETVLFSESLFSTGRNLFAV